MVKQIVFSNIKEGTKLCLRLQDIHSGISKYPPWNDIEIASRLIRNLLLWNQLCVVLVRMVYLKIHVYVI